MNKILFALFLLFMLLLAGCGSQRVYMCSDGSIAGNQEVNSRKTIYVCPDGREADSPDQCTFSLPLRITQDDAEDKALSFVQGYVRANGWQTTLVNTYKQEDYYQAQLIISKHDQPSYETIVQINGTSGLARCKENCDYLS